jgi:hypothetical protein
MAVDAVISFSFIYRDLEVFIKDFGEALLPGPPSFGSVLVWDGLGVFPVHVRHRSSTSCLVSWGSQGAPLYLRACSIRCTREVCQDSVQRFTGTNLVRLRNVETSCFVLVVSSISMGAFQCAMGTSALQWFTQNKLNSKDDTDIGSIGFPTFLEVW